MTKYDLYSEIELEQLLKDLESDLVERKEAWAGDAPDKARQAICAFANDLSGNRKPGVLFIGAKDDGTPTHTPITDELLLTLANTKTDGNILPLPSIFVRKHNIDGADIAVVTVLPSDAPPVRYKGRIWTRTGPRRAIATSQDERILNERRRFQDTWFDLSPIPGSTISDLDLLLFEREFLTRAFAYDVLQQNDRTINERLAALKMIDSIDNPIPTVCGILVLGKRSRDFIPGSYIQFLRIDGKDLSDDIIDEETISGTVEEILRRTEEKLVSHIRIGVDFTSSNLEQRRSSYPIEALQQIVRNAVMHRTYEGTSRPITVYWLSDRIEIINPGGPFGTVTVENFGKSALVDYRNPHLADALKVLGYVQRFGLGIRTAQRELHKNRNPPLEFNVDQSHILVTIPRAI